MNLSDVCACIKLAIRLVGGLLIQPYGIVGLSLALVDLGQVDVRLGETGSIWIAFWKDSTARSYIGGNSCRNRTPCPNASCASSLTPSTYLITLDDLAIRQIFLCLDLGRGRFRGRLRLGLVVVLPCLLRDGIASRNTGAHDTGGDHYENLPHFAASSMYLISTSPRFSDLIKLVEVTESLILSDFTSSSPATGNVSWFTLAAYSAQDLEKLL